MDDLRAKVVAEARAWIGTRWGHRGRGPFRIDCVGLVVLSRKAVGLPIEDQRGYGREPWNDRLRSEMRRQFGEPISQEQWKPGDVALFSVGDSEPQHIGVIGDYVYGGLSLIHAHNYNHVTEQALNNDTELKLIEVYPCLR